VIYYTAARLASASEVQCDFPTTPLDESSTSASYVWQVSISNDNVTYSQQFTFVVYDSRCLSCDSAGTCSMKVNSRSVNVFEP